MPSCRLCRSKLAAAAVFSLAPAPAGAQLLPLPGVGDVAAGEPLDLHHCGECGHWQLAGAPVPYFNEVHTAAGLSPAMRAARLEQLGGFVQRFSLEGKRVLEVGCGRGHMLPILSAVGAHPTGLEAGALALAEARGTGFPVLEGYPAPGLEVAGAPFDAFVCLNFLEHAPDPRAFLASIRSQLATGAVGLVEVPSFDRDLSAGRFYDLVRDHLNYFTLATLARALELSGFDVLETGTAWHDEDLYALVQVRAPGTVAGWEGARERTLADLRAFLDRVGAAPGGAAVWGASHQALTLLALAGVQGVRYVVDSAPFKQGRLTPITGLPIVAPSRLRTEPPAGVLVATGGYADEVVRILRQEFGFVGEIAVLHDGTVRTVA